MAVETETSKKVQAKMPIMRHLREMRDRVARSVIILVITTALSFIFGEQILEILIAPAGNIDLQAIELVENLAVYFKVALAGGIVLA
ncbi:MAG: twin-arginine translocase subunit TatC, partial [Dehalococcoidia bacterium]